MKKVGSNFINPKTIIYFITCILSFSLCFINNLHYYEMGFLGYEKFWGEAFITKATSSLTWDLIFLTLLIFGWMYQETKKHKIKYFWLYFIIAMNLAIAPPLSLFLIVREFKKH